MLKPWKKTENVKKFPQHTTKPTNIKTVIKNFKNKKKKKKNKKIRGKKENNNV